MAGELNMVDVAELKRDDDDDDDVVEEEDNDWDEDPDADAEDALETNNFFNCGSVCSVLRLSFASAGSVNDSTVVPMFSMSPPRSLSCFMELQPPAV